MANTLKEHESADRQWFAVSVKGTLTRLGDCGDRAAAQEVANSLNLDVWHWIIEPNTARQWLDVLKVLDTKQNPTAPWDPELWDPENPWDHHPDHPVEDWQYEVANGDTRRAYIDWVNSQIEQAEDD